MRRVIEKLEEPEKLEAGHAPAERSAIPTLTLDFDRRQRSRLRAVLDDGQEIGLFLPRGTVLRGGDLLRDEDGAVIRVAAAVEEVSTVRSEDPLTLARACYHLGNRHVPLQIAKGWVRYAHDHVLDDMVRGLGLEIFCEHAPFEPEPGAYGGGHRHGHGHGHSHDHDRAHGHRHAPANGRGHDTHGSDPGHG